MQLPPGTLDGRRVFGCSKAAALALVLTYCGIGHAGQEASLDVLAPAEREQFFQRYFDQMTAPKPLARFSTAAQWNAYRATLREKILRSVGLAPLPERVPLSLKTGRRIEHEDYVIERVYYQVFPGAYASGYLYTPKPAVFAGQSPTGPRRRLPAVLNPHGHWAQGAAHPVVQSRCIGLAKKGYVAFSPDSTHVADLGYGLCPIGLMTWNNLRALDYLESLDFVDPKRIACTGASGGGQQTMYLAAVDDRVRVLVPAVLVSYFRRILFVSEEAHCFCNHAPGIARVTDETEMAAMFAPRPTRFICATGDWTREFPRQEFPEIQHIYSLIGGDVDCVQFDKPHNYDHDSREQMYAWMNKYLLGLDDPQLAQEPDITPETPETLLALSRPQPGISGLEGARGYYRTKFGFKPPRLRGKADWRTYQSRLRADLVDMLGENAATTPPQVTSCGTAEAAGLKMEKLLIQTEPQVAVPAWLFLPNDTSRRRAAVVLVNGAGKQVLLRSSSRLVRDLLERDVTVLVVDPRFRGELRRNWHWNEVIWGRPEEGMAAHDLNAAGTWLRSRSNVDPKHVLLVGLGDAGRFALFAGALNDRWAGIALDAAGPLYSEADPLQCVPNLLRFGDLPQIAALTAPRRLWLNGARSRFSFTQSCYDAFGQASELKCSDLPNDAFEREFPGWLARAADTRN